MMIIVIVLFFYLTLAAHEAGHLIAGRLVRFRFAMLILGPLKLQSIEGRLRLSFNRQAYLFGAISLPTDEVRLHQRIAAVFLGGPVASVITFIALFGITPSVNRILEAQHMSLMLRVAVGLTMPIAGLLSLLYALLTGYPSRSPHAMNDGARALRLLRGGPQGERDAALFAVGSYNQLGRRPRDWNSAMVAAGTALNDSTLFEASSHMNAYYHHLDLGHVEAAEQHLNRALALKQCYPGPFREELLLEAAYYTAFYCHDAAAARDHLDAAGTRSSFTEQATRLRAEAATLLAEGRLAEARQKAEQGIGCVRAGTPHEREWLQAIQDLAAGTRNAEA